MAKTLDELLAERPGDPEARATHRARMLAAEPINELVERLRATSGRFVPHVSPIHGGVAAAILSVLRDPGPATNQTGVLSTENPDPTSRRQRQLMDSVGLAPGDLCPWNAYPWAHDPAVDGDVTPDLVARGAVVLAEVIGIMSNLRVLLLQGKHAHWAWAMVSAFEPELAKSRFTVVTTCHRWEPGGAPGRPRRRTRLRNWLRGEPPRKPRDRERAAAAVRVRFPSMCAYDLTCRCSG